MKALWKLTLRLMNRKPFTARRNCFLLLNCAASGLAGLVLWLIVRCFALNSVDWMVCFIGYPVMLYGYIGGLIYMLNIDDRSEE